MIGTYLLMLLTILMPFLVGALVLSIIPTVAYDLRRVMREKEALAHGMDRRSHERRRDSGARGLLA